MLESRWRRRAGPVLATIGVLLAVGGAAAGAPAARAGLDGVGPPPDCPPHGPRRDDAERPAWFALDPILERGALVGQRLLVGAVDGGTWAIALPAEAFATGPVDGRVLYGWDDGRRSTIRRFDAAGGCVTTVGTSDMIVRSALADPAGEGIHEHRVARSDRSDQGIWRRAADGTAERVLAGATPDGRFGITWRSELAWSSDGERLVAATCGEVACRFRILEPGGAVTSLADPGHGALVGLGDGRLVVRGACRGLPCPILAVDLEDEGTVVLAEAAGPAVLVEGAAGRASVVFAEQPDAGPVRQAALDGGGGAIAGTRGGVVPIPAGSGRGAELPPGWFLVAPAAAPLPSGPPDARTIDLPSRRLDEVWP